MNWITLARSMFALYCGHSERGFHNGRSVQVLKTAFKVYCFLLVLSVSVFAARTIAGDARGEVVAVDGSVHVVDAGGSRRPVEHTGFVLAEMDTVVTEDRASAVIRFDDGALAVLDQKSRLRVEKTRWLSHLGGRIYFTFTKFFGEERRIKTRFATLGIRGTTFIVYDDDKDQGVALQEGVLDIASTGPVFEIFKQRELDDFDAFTQQARQQQKEMREGFDEYRQQLSREFIEYRNSFTLDPGQVVRFDGARVDASAIGADIEAEFEHFEAIAGELLKAFRAQTLKRETEEVEPVFDEENPE